MHPYKQQVAKEILDIVQLTCANVLKPNDVAAEDPVEWVLHTKRDEAHRILRKIVNALPDKFFSQGILTREDALKEKVAKEFILFQVQESTQEENYSIFLANFIYEMINEINDEIFLGRGM